MNQSYSNRPFTPLSLNTRLSELKSELGAAIVETSDRAHREQLWSKFSLVSETLEGAGRAFDWQRDLNQDLSSVAAAMEDYDVLESEISENGECTRENLCQNL